MRTRVQKWGNSLALRIPRAFARQAGVEQDTEVELSLVDDKLVVVPVAETGPTLEQLLAGVTEQNLHAEIDTGRPIGREVW